MPATGEGTSASTLSVAISTIGSSSATASPMFFSHRVTVPSVTDSPMAGIVTCVPVAAGDGAAAGEGAAGSDDGTGAAATAGATGSGAGGAVGGVIAGASGVEAAGAADGAAAAPDPSPMIASSAPTSTVSSS